jgi:hypothetical protein
MTQQQNFTEDNYVTASTIAAEPNGQLVTHEAPTPMALIERAIEKGIDPDQLGKLFELQQRWEESCARKAYAAAMTAAQGEMRPVVRGRTNQQQNSKYAPLEDIHDAIKPIWLKHGFTLSYGSDASPYPEHYRVTCTCLHEAGHWTSHVLDGPGDEKGIKGNPNKTPIQALTSTVTYLRRSLAVMIFDVTLVGTDHDGQRAVPVITEEQAVQIKEWIESKNVNPVRFLEWAGVKELSMLPASKYQQAIDFLKRK